MTLIGHNVGVSITATELTQGKAFGVGDMTDDGAGNTYMFVQASAALSIGSCAAIQADYKAKGVTIDVGKEAVEIGFAQVAIGENEYGWVQTGGRGLVRLAADCDKELALYATATAGVLDDATVSTMIQGVVCVTSVTGAVTAATCVIRFPTIVRAVTLGAV